MTDKLLPLNHLGWPIRLPAKWGVLGLTVLAVCFPYPNLLVRHLQHWRDPNRLIEPEAACLEPWVAQLASESIDEMPPRDALAYVQRFVHKKIAYDWDWNTWGTADYMPTVAEAVEKGREDCDGRAVVAASLLAHFGFHAQIVTNFAHVWVRTEHGDTMGPGKRTAVESDADGLRIRASAILDVPKALAYGVAAFPFAREIIILLVAWWLMLRRGGGTVCSAVALALLMAGLLCLRVGGRDYYRPQIALQWIGAITLAAGALSLLVWSKRNAMRCAAPSSHRAAAD